MSDINTASILLSVPTAENPVVDGQFSLAGTIQINDIASAGVVVIEQKLNADLDEALDVLKQLESELEDNQKKLRIDNENAFDVAFTAEDEAYAESTKVYLETKNAVTKRTNIRISDDRTTLTAQSVITISVLDDRFVVRKDRTLPVSAETSSDLDKNDSLQKSIYEYGEYIQYIKSQLSNANLERLKRHALASLTIEQLKTNTQNASILSAITGATTHSKKAPVLPKFLKSAT
jgi:hypothetical protein